MRQQRSLIPLSDSEQESRPLRLWLPAHVAGE
jgi:hypothetical protein